MNLHNVAEVASLSIDIVFMDIIHVLYIHVLHRIFLMLQKHFYTDIHLFGILYSEKYFVGRPYVLRRRPFDTVARDRPPFRSELSY